jgi:hypothetical protein
VSDEVLGVRTGLSDVSRSEVLALGAGLGFAMGLTSLRVDEKKTTARTCNVSSANRHHVNA